MTYFQSEFKKIENPDPRPAWVEIDTGAIERNIERTKARLMPGTEFCAVVKANAYGHGQDVCMRLLMEHGINSFAVATLSEAKLAREISPDGRVYVLGLVPPEDFGFVLDYNITLGLCDQGDAKALSDAALARGKRSPVFAIVNTGMNRLGYHYSDPDIVEKIRRIADLPGLELLGLMSHFSSADEFDEEGQAYTRMQLERFEDIRKRAESAGIPLPYNSLANSAASLLIPESHYQIARPGGVIFGDYADSLPPELGIEYCMNVRAKIMIIQELPKGSAIGYGRHTILRRDSRIGTLNVGYADGFPRMWSCEEGYVLVHGKKAPIVGVICMDQMMIDLTDIPEAERFDTATLIGRDGDLHITPEEIGACIGSIFDPTVIAMAQRLPYRYIR